MLRPNHASQECPVVCSSSPWFCWFCGLLSIRILQASGPRTAMMLAEGLKTGTQSNKNVHTYTRRERPGDKKTDLVRSGTCLEKSGGCLPQKSMTQNMRFDDSRLKGKGNREYIAAIEVAELIHKGSFNQICTKLQKRATWKSLVFNQGGGLPKLE